MNPYEILGVPHDATEDQIKQAYRQLVKKWHPDVNKSPEAELKFKDISAAYEQIKNPPQENIFDRFGFSFHDIFTRNAFNSNYIVDVSITLEDAYVGKTLNISLPNEQLSVPLPAGIDNGRFVIRGKGPQTNPQMPPGNLILNIFISPHKEFERHGLNLQKNVNVDAFNMILGYSDKTKGIDGNEILFIVPAGSQHDSVIRIKGKGMKNESGKHGDLLLVLKVVIPDVSFDKKEQLKALLTK